MQIMEPRKIIRYSQLLLVIVSLILIFSNPAWFPSYYKPLSMALIGLFYAFLIEVPVFVFRSQSPNLQLETSRTKFQAALGVSLLFSGLGSLGLWGLYKEGIPYDKFVHFFISVVLTATGIHLIHAWRNWSFKKTVIVVLVISCLVGVAWEFTEYFFDKYVHLGYFGKLFDADGMHDLLFDFLGTFLGGLIAMATNRK